MRYLEILPDDILTNHIESYWEVNSAKSKIDHKIEILLPTCTFNIIFFTCSCHINTKSNSNFQQVSPGAYFFGQRTKSIIVRANDPIKLFGARFKPYAFSAKYSIPFHQLNDEFHCLDKLFDLDMLTKKLVHEILITKLTNKKMQLMNQLMYKLLRGFMSVDEKLRAQLNYIMDRKGDARITDLLDEFSTNKVTLRKHFINKVGLTPKKVSQIWRMNYMLQMQVESPNINLTTLCLRAGFYDQAHFNKNFKQLFTVPPRKFFEQNNDVLRLAQYSILKRFNNQYDPR